MEVELKFLIEDSIEREKILYDSHLAEMMDEDKIEEIEMKAVYFDTEDFSLCDAEYAF